MRPPKGDKTPLKQHLLKVYEATGIKPPQLAQQPAKPAELEYLLGWFYSLHAATRGRVTYGEMVSFATLMQINIRAWETVVLQRLALAFRV